ncbi:unnamed protein product [Ilex paraguariensis]|uniref:Stress-response A/B barrel domain-containing protein n=1 Tax=Ilex paraguariensis TaxID=185542 RepID=A0ABC8RA54_9AQUA
MHTRTHGLSPSSSHLTICYLSHPTSKILAYARQPVGDVKKLNAKRNKKLCWRVDSKMFSDARGKWNHVSLLNGVLKMNVHSRQMESRGAIFSTAEGGNLSTVMQRKRNVVEHICLLKAKENLSDEEEKDMLDYLYTTQYQMGGIIAISLGRISGQNHENYTHAIYMRFQKREYLAKFYQNPFYLGVLKDHVMPYCHEIDNVDFESEVEDDILPIFRKGEDFNYGVEFVLLIAFLEGSLGGPAEDALASLEKLTLNFPSLIVQATQGSNIDDSDMEYTHGVVIRFRSREISYYTQPIF